MSRGAARDDRAFFVPDLGLRGERGPMGESVLRDVVDVTFTDGIDRIDSFTVTLVNWDETTRTPKYSDAKDFLPGKGLALSLGYRGAGELTTMLAGEITVARTHLPADGLPTLTVTAVDVLHRLRDVRRTAVYEKMTDDAIAKKVAKRLGVRIRTTPVDGPVHPYVLQDNEYDVVFLLGLARRAGYELWVEQGDLLRFGVAGKTEVHELVWGGGTLVEFEPVLNFTRQVEGATVRGWDRSRKEPIVASATAGALPGPREKDLKQALAAARRGREDITVGVVASAGEAKHRALGRLRTLGTEVLRATGSTVGLPEIRAGCRIEVGKVGTRFSGIYYVTGTEHRLGRSGYRTHFDCRREW
ncbi:phage late control D family protein [Saccharothrix syringae]|uniref:Phage late control D family protein n=1 Tax=Saccharothrix syringae TaxID=103733 RepID=A0A5Q0GY94_SACSY|nr:contractile injection system protein, VgrG/Pvc8 family [Saccharothrix syringae]QFZ18655.1 phage late control D family protein [Saccharothrix syringae]